MCLPALRAESSAFSDAWIAQDLPTKKLYLCITYSMLWCSFFCAFFSVADIKSQQPNQTRETIRLHIGGRLSVNLSRSRVQCKTRRETARNQARNCQFLSKCNSKSRKYLIKNIVMTTRSLCRLTIFRDPGWHFQKTVWISECFQSGS